ERYPEIFPNFYLLPMEHLDRLALIELREFCLAMKARFRWLLVAIHQNTQGLLGFYNNWRERRVQVSPDRQGSELRQYYRIASFQDDLIAFLHDHPAKATISIKRLLEYEEAVRHAVPEPQTHQDGIAQPGEALWWSDIPARRGRTRIIELSFDIRELIECLKSGKQCGWREGSYFYSLH